MRTTAAIESPQPSATLTKAVYDQIRSNILQGKLRPGEKLGAEVLRRRFNTGTSPVREALNRLLAEGFVALEEQKGFRVASVSRSELKELVTARCWVDTAAVTDCIRRFDRRWEEQLVLALHRLSNAHRGAYGQGQTVDWESLHRSFHLALVSGCSSRWIVRISEQLFDAAERYRLLGAAYVEAHNELDEHRTLVTACFERDEAKAARIIESHYGRTFAVVMQNFRDETEA